MGDLFPVNLKLYLCVSDPPLSLFGARVSDLEADFLPLSGVKVKDKLQWSLETE